MLLYAGAALLFRDLSYISLCMGGRYPQKIKIKNKMACRVFKSINELYPRPTLPTLQLKEQDSPKAFTSRLRHM